jgi:uncharacterized circularly permuted ATP-grasp superfamily protein/uncharacterized alpha-E superfamily protein
VTLTPTTGGPLGGYRPPTSGIDELVDDQGRLRPHWADVARAYEGLGLGELYRRRDEIGLLLEQDGVTYNIAYATSGSGRRRHRPWQLDPVPLVVPDDEWAAVERGVIQRARLLDLVLRDLYGERRLLREGLIPPEIILVDPQFSRACDGITLPGPRQLVVSAADLVRTADRGWIALGHRTQAPSGAAYALENRRVVARVFPNLFHGSEIQRLAPFVRALRTALRHAAPSGTDDPTVVLLSPGSMSETAFEHASIAAQLGYPLVEGADLEVREGRVWLRTVARLVPVDVILRRVDAWFCDPLELRSDSTLGVPGLVDACRTGTVSVVNTLGSGVLENAALLALLPALAPPLLGEELVLQGPATWWCGDPRSRSHVVANLGELVVRRLSRISMEHSYDTRQASSAELDTIRRRIEADPSQWVGQEHVEAGTAPMLGDDGIEARRSVLRTFAVAADDGYVVMKGGLARTAGPDAAGPIANRAGALAKDVWVTGGGAESDSDFWLAPIDEVRSVASSAPAARAAENLFWLGRYAERAESTVRLLRTVHGRLDELQSSTAGPGRAALTVLLEAVTRITGTFPGFVGDDGSELQQQPEPELWALLVDESRPGTVAQAIDCMFEAIDVVRDQLSVDTWLVIGSLQQRLDGLGADGTEHDEAVATMLDELLHGLLALSGLGSESMVRDPAWHFMEAGRRLERAVQMVALLAATLRVERGAAAESLVLESVLTVGESIITYRRRHRSRAQVATVLDLLLTDEGNPRSLRYQVDALHHNLATLAQQRPDDRSSEALPMVAEVVDLVHGLDTDSLATPDVRGNRLALQDFAGLMRERLHAASDALATDFFTRMLPQHRLVTPVESPRSSGPQGLP